MSKITLQGICHDEKSSFMQGPALAPPLIRKAYTSPSANLYAEDGTYVTKELFVDKGDFKVSEYFEIEEITIANLEQGLPLLTFGGDHSITYPILRAFHKKYGELPILHIDAHSDMYSNFEGDPYSHACPFHNIVKNGLSNDLTQVGVRTLSEEQIKNIKKYNVTVVEAKDLASFQMPNYKNPFICPLTLMP